MRFFPYKQFDIRTDLTFEQIQQQLLWITDTSGKRRDPFSKNKKPYRGTINDKIIRILPMKYDPDVFIPVFHIKLQGTTLKITAELDKIGKISLISLIALSLLGTLINLDTIEGVYAFSVGAMAYLIARYDFWRITREETNFLRHLFRI